MKKKMIACTSCQEEKDLTKMKKFVELQKIDKASRDKTENKNVLEENVTLYTGENLAKQFTWDEPTGKEIW